MKLVKYQGSIPECIENFPKETQRSSKETLHLRPGQSRMLTDDEYAYIKVHRPDVAKNLLILRQEVKKEEKK